MVNNNIFSDTTFPLHHNQWLTKEIFDKFDVAEYIGNENTVFSYGYYDDSLYADGDELKKV